MVPRVILSAFHEARGTNRREAWPIGICPKPDRRALWGRFPSGSAAPTSRARSARTISAGAPSCLRGQRRAALLTPLTNQLDARRQSPARACVRVSGKAGTQRAALGSTNRVTEALPDNV